MFCRNHLIYLKENKAKRKLSQSTRFWVYIRSFFFANKLVGGNYTALQQKQTYN